jgi:hypothetical protein
MPLNPTIVFRKTGNAVRADTAPEMMGKVSSDLQVLLRKLKDGYDPYTQA